MNRRLKALEKDMSLKTAEMLSDELAEIDDSTALDDDSQQHILSSVMKKAGFEMNRPMKDERNIQVSKAEKREPQIAQVARFRRGGVAAACAAILLAGAIGTGLIFGQRMNSAQPAKTTPGSAVTEIRSEAPMEPELSETKESEPEAEQPEQPEQTSESSEPIPEETTDGSEPYLEIIYDDENPGEKEVTLSIPVPEWIDDGIFNFSLAHECGFRGDTSENEFAYAFFDGKAYAGKTIEIKATGKGKDRIEVHASGEYPEDDQKSLYAGGCLYAIYNVDFDNGTAAIDGCANDSELRRFSTDDVLDENCMTVCIQAPQGIWGSYTFEVYGDGELAAQKTVWNNRDRIEFRKSEEDKCYCTNLFLYDKHYDNLEVYVRSNTADDHRSVKYATYKPDYSDHNAELVGSPDEEAILSITPKDRNFGVFPPVEDETGCTHLTMSVPLPEGLKGEYTFDVYRDNFLIYTKTVQDASTVSGGTVDFDIVGKGKEELIVYATSSNFDGGSCTQYADYDVDYDAQTVKQHGKLKTKKLMSINPE